MTSENKPKVTLLDLVKDKAKQDRYKDNNGILRDAKNNDFVIIWKEGDRNDYKYNLLDIGSRLDLITSQHKIIDEALENVIKEAGSEYARYTSKHNEKVDHFLIRIGFPTLSSKSFGIRILKPGTYDVKYILVAWKKEEAVNF